MPNNLKVSDGVIIVRSRGLIKHYESLLVSAMVARFRKYKLSIWKRLSNLKDSDETIIVNSADIYLLKVNNRNTRTRCETCSNLTIKTIERRQWHLVLAFLLLTLDTSLLAEKVTWLIENVIKSLLKFGQQD